MYGVQLSVMNRYHAYKDVWCPIVGDESFLGIDWTYLFRLWNQCHRRHTQESQAV